MPEVVAYENDMVAQRVYHLRQVGMDWRAIKEDLVAHNYVETAPTTQYLRVMVSEYTKEMSTYLGASDREMLLAMELSRLDVMQAALWPDVERGDPRAIHEALNIMTTRAKLTGMDQLNVADKQTLATVLIVGGDRQAYIEALTYGRKQLMAGQLPDDEEELEGESLEH